MNANDTDTAPKPSAEQSRKAVPPGTFTPPPEFSIPPELEPPTPRPIPSAIRRGPRRSRFGAVLLFIYALASTLILSSLLGLTRPLTDYFLGARYFLGVGIGLAVAALPALLYFLFAVGRLRYIRDGNPIVLRILSVRQLPLGGSKTDQFLFEYGVQFRHPVSGAIETGTVKSPQIASLSSSDRYDSALRPGDYVTGVYLPGVMAPFTEFTFKDSLRIYDWLGLDPNRTALLKDGKPYPGSPGFVMFLTVFLMLLGLVVFLVATMIYPDRVEPMADTDPAMIRTLFIAAAVSFLPFFWLFRRYRVRNGLRMTSRIICALGLAFFFAVASALSLPFLNALYSTSEPDFREVEITAVVRTTVHPVGIRSYSIEFAGIRPAMNGKRGVPLSDVRSLMATRAAVLDVRKGLLGWPWIRNVYPVVARRVAEAPEDAQPDKNNPITPSVAESPIPPGIRFVLELPDNPETPVSDALLRHIQARVRDDPQTLLLLKQIAQGGTPTLDPVFDREEVIHVHVVHLPIF